jgi:ribonuclease-3
VLLGRKEDPLRALETTLGYRFKDRSLLETALTTPSYRAEHAAERVPDNQRLEFLGDAVFGLLAAQRLFESYSDEDEGRLTVRRSGLASGRALAELARRAGLGAHLRIGRTDEASGGRDKDKALTDAMEAVFGRHGTVPTPVKAQRVFAALVPDEARADSGNVWADNPKGELQELAQRRAWPDSPQYELAGVAGPSHEPVYTVTARVAGGHEAAGAGRTKRAAEAAAARALLSRLAELGLT